MTTENKTVQELAREWLHENGFYRRPNITWEQCKQIFKAGHASRQQEIDGLKHDLSAANEINAKLSERHNADLEIIETLKAENQRMIGALEHISKTDVCEKAPDIMWLCNWRNMTKAIASNALTPPKESEAGNE